MSLYLKINLAQELMDLTKTNMKKLLALLLLLPFLIQSEEETFEQCIAIPLDEESSSGYEACFERF
jgi:hypothetical protein